jgi:hypothetical protein
MPQQRATSANIGYPLRLEYRLGLRHILPKAKRRASLYVTDQIIKKEHLDTVIEFMKSISELLKKEVILTPESTPSNVLIAVNFRNQIKIFSKQEYKLSIGKPLSVFQRLKKVYCSFLFGMLKFVSIEKVRNILAGHIIEASGANRKHVASRKNKSVFD